MLKKILIALSALLGLTVLVMVGFTAVLFSGGQKSGADYSRLAPEALKMVKMSPPLAGMTYKYPLIRFVDRLYPPAKETSVALVSNFMISQGLLSVPVRLYQPLKPAGRLIVYYHGGGFVIGSIPLVDGICRQLASRYGAAVLSVDYRLAPENPYPAAVDDCYAALVWADANRVTLAGKGASLLTAGDSAGGNLAAVVCQIARDQKGPQIQAQILFYPVVDRHDGETLKLYPSLNENAEGYILTRSSMEDFGRLYIQKPPAVEAYAYPIRAASLKNLPPAFIALAEFDPLRDEGMAYGRRLNKEGGQAEIFLLQGYMHGFMNIGVEGAKQTYARLDTWMEKTVR